MNNIDNGIGMVTSVVKASWFDRLPKPLRIILIIISIVTIIFWLCKLIFNLLKINRIVMAYIFDKDHYWTFVICLLMIGLAFATFYQVEYNVFGNLWNEIVNYAKELKL